MKFHLFLIHFFKVSGFKKEEASIRESTQVPVQLPIRWTVWRSEMAREASLDLKGKDDVISSSYLH